MHFRPTYFIWLFIFLVLSDSIVGASAFSGFRFITKPMILIALIAYFIGNGKHLTKSTYYLTLSALFFSLLGDIFLIFDHGSNLYFISGLVSFLFAHILYTIVFLQQSSRKKSLGSWLITLLFLGYGATLFVLLQGSLDQLKLPVIIYILAILVMAVSAYGRREKVNAISFNLVFLGALFFMASDTLLAIDKFMFDVPWSSFAVMGTYATAQFLIVKGLLYENMKKN
ncbi:lysoplasmalogenase [uncultured Kriegella sp.]|uniref:lysoplasmalogenase n=1 Tax=uncultured Kriegella sp. TaxID=1798910 RepID=UPI0030D91F56|tara:strand:- start:15507 stop:16187 length:681 start_codon:yes stop_codon:yes gene_type:complete